MPKPFDAATKFLVEAAPEEWVRFLGLPFGETRIVDTDISTVSAAADRALFVEAGVPYGIQIEFQGNGDPTFETRLLQYRTALRLRWGVPLPRRAGVADSGGATFRGATRSSVLRNDWCRKHRRRLQITCEPRPMF